jgi:hypothetical protein
VDDEQITSAGIMPQPLGRTPLIVGFNVNTSLFRILNDALLLQRRKLPPTVDSILADLHSVNDLREKVMQVTVDVASPLKMRKGYDSRATRWVCRFELYLLISAHHTIGKRSYKLDSLISSTVQAGLNMPSIRSSSCRVISSLPSMLSDWSFFKPVIRYISNWPCSPRCQSMVWVV